MKNGALDRAALGHLQRRFQETQAQRRHATFHGASPDPGHGYRFRGHVLRGILDAPLLQFSSTKYACQLSSPGAEPRLRRANRDNIDEGRKRIDAQMPLALKLERCDVALQNDVEVALHAVEKGVLPRLQEQEAVPMSLPGFIFVAVLMPPTF